METKNNDSVLDTLLNHLAQDQKEMEVQNELIRKAQEIKKDILLRIRDVRNDLKTFSKYASEEQIKRLKELGFDQQTFSHTLNREAQLAMDILQKTPKGEMSNGALYDAYCATFKNVNEASTYAQFNIKCRSLFNTQKLLRITKEGTSSKEDLIRINGFRAQPAKAEKVNSKK